MNDHRHDDDGHHHDRGNGHHHGHEHDQGLRGALRYLRFAREMWSSDINEAVIDLVAPAAGERVVDIGAGMGAGLGAATRNGATVVAVEPTPFMRRILTARRMLRRDRDRVEVLDGTAEHLPIDDDSIDALWAVNTMHHWSDHIAAAGEIRRVLRPKGRLVLVDESFDDPSHPDHERFSKRHGDDEHHGFTMVDADRMEALLRDAGFPSVTAESRTIAGVPAIVVVTP